MLGVSSAERLAVKFTGEPLFSENWSATDTQTQACSLSSDI